MVRMVRLHPIESQLRAAAQSLGLRGQRLLLAVSGGADSVAMLLAFERIAPLLRLELVVATVDHGLRRGSVADCRYVARLAGRHGIPCEVRKVEPGRSGGVEAASRQARYRALEAVARERGCHAIATAHTLEDQVETVILRLGRGTGTRGLRGILRRRGRVVRPMLEVSAPPSPATCGPGGPPAGGSDQPQRRLDRNRSAPRSCRRSSVALGLRRGARFARAAQVALEDERYLEARARACARSLRRPGEQGELRADAAGCARSPRRCAAGSCGSSPSRRSRLPLTARHVARMEEALQSAGPARVALPRGHELAVAYGELRLGPRLASNGRAPFEHRIDGPGLYRVGELRVSVTEIPASRPEPPARAAGRRRSASPRAA
jgi:tRNA(Ile)-lysidine synthase